MFGSEALEIGLGVTFIYLILSLTCTAFTEIFSAAIRLRAGVLRDGIYNLLSQQRYGFSKKIFGRYNKPPEGDHTQGTTLAEQFYRHPLIRTLYEKGHGPSYIPAHTFAVVLQDLLGLNNKQLKSAGGLGKHLVTLQEEAENKSAIAKGSEPEEVVKDKQRLATVFNTLAEEVRQDMVLAKEGSILDQARLMAEITGLGIADEQAQALLEEARTKITDADVELAQLREKIEVWYNNVMDRVGGWYRRWTKAISFATALVIVISINADTIEIAGTLTSNDALREALVNQAEVYAQESATSPDSLLRVLLARRAATQDTLATSAQADSVDRPTLDAAILQWNTANERLGNTMTQLKELGLPLGWTDKGFCGWVPLFCKQKDEPDRHILFFPKLLGLLITAFALTLGAPFWFDVLNKIVSIRSSGKSTEEKPKSPEAKPKRPEEVAPQ